ncbi:MAG: fibronectin type III domain-containing protein [Brevinema sp.]
MNTYYLKQLFALFFLIISILVAAHIPVHAIFNSSLFHVDQIKTLSLSNQNFHIFRSKGLSLSNIQNKQIVTLAPIKKDQSLYDLNLDFDTTDFLDNYDLVSSNYEVKQIENKSFGKFVMKNNLILLPNNRSILDIKSNDLQSFTIKFSLMPYTSGEGSQIIASYSTDNLKHETENYGFNIFIESGIVKYSFYNFFYDENKTRYSFTLEEKQSLTNQKIEEHCLVVDKVKKIIKIYRNGIEQDVHILTADQTPNGSPLFDSASMIQEKIPLIIGQNAIFSLEYFSILKGANYINTLQKDDEPNYFETDIITLSSNDSWIDEIKPELNEDSNFIYRIAYRFAQDYFLPETESAKIPWVYIDPQQKTFPESQKFGKYIQLRFEYFETIKKETVNNFYLYNIVTSFRETMAPGIVDIKKVAAKDQVIQISWDALPSDNIESYEIFYGTSPDNYFGSATVSPESPITVKNISTYPKTLEYKLEGLENNKTYYIAIRAKNIYGSYGDLSKELFAVPMSTKNDLGYSIGR